MDPSRALLQRYLTESSEAAFRELVERHTELVYQTALRRAGGDAALARDAAQVVFTDLARKAGSLPAGTVIAGWLHRHTGFVTAKLIRTEQRRRQREHTAAMENAPTDSETEALWQRMAPVLDEALGHLSMADRDALVLRYLQGRDLREVGGMIGLTENSARMRVSRALEKLRGILARRGITGTALTLGAALGWALRGEAPSGLSQTLATTALHATSAAGGLTTAAAGTWPWWGKAAAVLATCGAVILPVKYLTPPTPKPARPVEDRVAAPRPQLPAMASTKPAGPPLAALPAETGILPAPAAAAVPEVVLERSVVPILAQTVPLSQVEPDEGTAQSGVIKLMLGVVPLVMKFDKPLLQVKAGSAVMMLFRNEKDALMHNFVLTHPGKLNDVGALADQLMTDPAALARAYRIDSPEVLVQSTRLLSLGQSEIIEFTAPAAPGDYPYLCSFPGHWRIMNGILRVLP